MSKFTDALNKTITGTVLKEESLNRHTTWRIGGPAEVLVIPENQEDVLTALKLAAEYGKEVTVIGNGSNLLVSDLGLRGLVLKMTGGIDGSTLTGTELFAQSGCLLPGLARKTVEAGLSGLEFAVGIPASLGGAITMNAGAHGGELAKVTKEVLVCNLKGQVQKFTRQECRFGYRSSRFQTGDYIVLAVTLELEQGDREKSRAVMRDNLEKRRRNQPLEFPNAGSIFKNPPGTPAGKLIEESGAKGLLIGGAMVSEKHANFIVNIGNATAEDVLNLIKRIQEMVYAKFQVELHPEIRVLGCSRK